MQKTNNSSIAISLLLNVSAIFCYIMLSIPINFIIPAPFIELSRFPNDIALGLPVAYYQFIADGLNLQQGFSIINTLINLTIPSTLILIIYCGAWLWIMPAETEKQKQNQEKIRLIIRNQLVIIGLFIGITSYIVYNTGSIQAVYINLLIIYIVNLSIYLKYESLERKAEEIKEEEFDDVTY